MAPCAPHCLRGLQLFTSWGWGLDASRSVYSLFSHRFRISKVADAAGKPPLEDNRSSSSWHSASTCPLVMWPAWPLALLPMARYFRVCKSTVHVEIFRAAKAPHLKAQLVKWEQ